MTKRKIALPLRWGRLILAVIVFLMFLLTTVKCFPSLLGYVFGLYAVISLVAVLRLCVHYTITEECLIANFLGIPYRKISWERVESAMYVHKWKDFVSKYSAITRGMTPRSNIIYGRIIFVTLIGCPEYIPTYHHRVFFSLMHPFSTMCLWLPDPSKYPTDQILDTFKEYYPNFQIQP